MIDSIENYIPNPEHYINTDVSSAIAGGGSSCEHDECEEDYEEDE